MSSCSRETFEVAETPKTADVVKTATPCRSKKAKEVPKKETDSCSEGVTEEATPTTFQSDSESSGLTNEEGDEDAESSPEVRPTPPPQLGPGLYNDDDDERLRKVNAVQEAWTPDTQVTTPLPPPPITTQETDYGADEYYRDEPSIINNPPAEPVKFTKEHSLFVFDWDDTILPSSWIQSQGLRLDDNSFVSEEQAAMLAEVAVVAGRTLQLAKEHGTVVLVTNAERGWIELSCHKFLPTLCPAVENVRIVSARTTYEGPDAPSPLDWKIQAFYTELDRMFNADEKFDPAVAKNVISLGDGIHEREALQHTTLGLPNCHPKSLKFVERPDISQILKQHDLIYGCFNQIFTNQGALDLGIRCE